MWERPSAESDLIWNLCGGTVAAALFIAFVRQGWQRLAGSSTRPRHGLEVASWLVGLVVMSFAWLWIVQEVAPIESRLGKSPFVLYYASSSGYFTRARFDEPRAGPFLAGYEDLMRQGDVLHTGTHPPGLFLAFHGLIAACESSPALSALLDVTQPPSFRDANDVISANNLRRHVPRPLLPLDRRVLWLATVLVMLSGSMTVIPLYGLLRRTCSTGSAWIGAALWPALPAVAVFIPKADAMFPLMGLTLLWLWLNAWDRRSLVLALMAGAATWIGLFCSLAFLPVLLVAALLTRVSAWSFSETTDESPLASADPSHSQPPIGTRRWLCVVAASLGFLIPTLVLWQVARVNLLNVWWLNYRNHSGFYQQYSRTYWKWLLVNPLELAYAAGWPVALLATVACWSVLSRFRTGRSYERTNRATAIGSLVTWPMLRASDLPTNLSALCSNAQNAKNEDILKPELQRRTNVGTAVISIVIVWGLLWLTGKNSGEAARLWILFLPWLVWLASIRIDEIVAHQSGVKSLERQILALLAIQFIVCLLTVARVSGFHSEAV